MHEITSFGIFQRRTRDRERSLHQVDYVQKNVCSAYHLSDDIVFCPFVLRQLRGRVKVPVGWSLISLHI